MDLRQVHAVVTDREVLASLKPSVVARYLRERGWSENGGRSTARVWVRGGNGRSDALVLPNDPEFGDFALRMGEVLTAIAEAEGRSQLAVLSDLLDAGEEVRG
jgi:hypothetical protein